MSICVLSIFIPITIFYFCLYQALLLCMYSSKTMPKITGGTADKKRIIKNVNNIFIL